MSYAQIWTLHITVGQHDTSRANAISDYISKTIDNLAFSGPGNSLNKDDFHACCIDDVGAHLPDLNCSTRFKLDTI